MQERRVEPAVTAGPGRVAGRRYALGAAVALVVVAVDQLTKTWAEHALRDHNVHVVWTLQFALTFNSGVAFGLGRGVTPILVVLAVAVAVVLIGFSRRVPTAARAVAMGLLLGGAAGNLVDRLVRANGGAVIDFIDLQWWPVFNVADAAVTCGAILLVLTSASQP